MTTTDAARDAAADASRIEAAIAGLLAECGSNRSISPEDAARALAGEGADWHKLLPAVRRTAIGMAAAGLIDILRKGRPVDPAGVKGVIRLRAKPTP